MHQSTFLKTLLLAICATNIFALRRSGAKREHSPLNHDPIADESQNQGFFEDINFKSFFEDVGLKSSPSAPEAVKHTRPAPHQQRFAHQPSQSNDYGFLPADPLFEGSESRSHFTVINSNDDFFAQESNPFNDFYGFDSNPFAASQQNRDYIDPYAESRRSVNFEDFGPPKGFFDHDFSSGFGGGDNSDKKKKNNNNAQETRSEPQQYAGEESQANKDKTKKCETIHKDKMTCEICKDDFGGFSEHCNHNIHSGKDQKYANSRRRSHQDTNNPQKNQGGHGGHGGHGQPANDQASSINTRAYQSPVNHPQATVQNNDRRSNDFGNYHYSNPFAQQSKVNPYSFDYLKEIDEVIDTGLKNLHNHRQKLADSLPKKKTQTVEKKENIKINNKDSLKQASNKDVQQNQQQPQHNQHHPQHNHATHNPTGQQYQKVVYKPMDPVENFQVLGKMVKQFAKKDRANCKKRVTKKGMTCYVCPNKHGQVDEECMYENADPKQGVHMMYKEEVTY